MTMPGERDPHDYTIEVCIECGAQLNRGGNGRCPVAPEHWSRGGMVVRVVARPDEEQDVIYQRHSRVVPPIARGADHAR
jgi:hypothetical protein